MFFNLCKFLPSIFHLRRGCRLAIDNIDRDMTCISHLHTSSKIKAALCGLLLNHFFAVGDFLHLSAGIPMRVVRLTVIVVISPVLFFFAPLVQFRFIAQRQVKQHNHQETASRYSEKQQVVAGIEVG